MKCSICPKKAYPECKATCTEYQNFVTHARKRYEGRRANVQYTSYACEQYPAYDHTPTHKRKGSFS